MIVFNTLIFVIAVVVMSNYSVVPSVFKLSLILIPTCCYLIVFASRLYDACVGVNGSYCFRPLVL